MAEVVYRTIRETEPDPRLFDFLFHAIQFLESTTQSVANYHLVFLLHLLYYLGIYPNADSVQSGTWFDLLNGEFVALKPQHSHVLNQQETVVFSRLLKMSFENMTVFAFSRQDRMLIITRLLEYYRLHMPEFGEIKSLNVLQSLFD